MVATLSRMNEEYLRFVCAYGMEMFHRRAGWDHLHSKCDIYICQILRMRLSHIYGNHRCEPSWFSFVIHWLVAHCAIFPKCGLLFGGGNTLWLPLILYPSALPLSPARLTDAEHIVCSILSERNIGQKPIWKVALVYYIDSRVCCYGSLYIMAASQPAAFQLLLRRTVLIYTKRKTHHRGSVPLWCVCFY